MQFDHDYHSQKEKDQHWMEEEREHMSDELAKQKKKWLQRQKRHTLHTETDEMGHFAEETEASMHHHDKNDMEHGIGEAESIAHSKIKPNDRYLECIKFILSNKTTLAFVRCNSASAREGGAEREPDGRAQEVGATAEAPHAPHGD